VTVTAHETFVIPYGAPDPTAGRVGLSLEMPYGVWGRLHERSVEDVIASIKKYIAQVLDAEAGEFLAGHDPETGGEVTSPSWEVRFWDEQAAFRFPFARVAEIGQETVLSENPRYSDHTQSVTVHLYPHPAPDSEQAILGARRLKSIIATALERGEDKGRPWLIPLWDFGGVRSTPGDPFGVYGDSESRQPWDFMRVVGLSLERMIDPEDDRYVVVVATFRARWRRVPSVPLGRLVESVRMTAHPS
jgi:hypothetical protein